MEIKLYLSIARRWAWLLILGLVLGVVSGYVGAKLQKPVYQASTRVIASRASMQAASNAGSSSFGEGFYYISDQQLMQTYIELLKSSSIFEKASQALGYPVSSGQVQASQVNDTRILNISVEDADPQRAADIANAVVDALILQNEEIEASRYKASDESLQIQIKQVEEQIASFQKTLDNQASITLSEQLAQVKAQMEPLETETTQLKKEIAILTPALTADQKSKVAELNARLDRIQPLLDLYQKIYADLVVVGDSGSTQNDNAITTRLQSTLVLYQQIYLNLINTREAIRLSRLQNSQSIDQIQVAVVPGAPIRPQPLTSAMLAGVVGLMLAGGIVFLIEYLDDTLKTPEDVDRVLGIPLIGYISEMETVSNAESEVHVSRQPRSPASEAFRSLRANLEFAAVEKHLKIILVTGAEAGVGKTTVAANLAAIFALGGKRVILLDCDLRRPRVHRFLGLQNRVGMTDLFRNTLDVESVIQQWMSSSATSVSVITSGNLLLNPAEMLGSQKMDHILAELADHADVIVIDSPPSMVSDAQVLAAKVDGVLMVLQPGKTHRSAARATLEQLERAGARIVGAVFNRITRQSGYYYGYYSPYYSQNDQYFIGDDVNPEDVLLPGGIEQETLPQSLLGRYRPLLDGLLKSNSVKRFIRILDSRRMQPHEQGQTLSESSPVKRETLEEVQVVAVEQDEASFKSALGKVLKRMSPEFDVPVATTTLTPARDVSLTPTPTRNTTLSVLSESVETTGTPSKLRLDTLIGTNYKFVIHKVLKGETLEYIAKGCKTSVEAILAVNYNLTPPVLAYTIVIIPFGFTDVARLPSFMAHEVVEAGDTAESLAKKLQVNPFDLEYYNNINAGERLLLGDFLLVPSHRPVQ